ncbi:hypothetical protein K438DRAFT_1823111 [Mycena galopus ATCC 62051]|nr:hypothetical protein K438DRAFT_1823111 [Mycena galopus ATCC 62051]
MSSPFASQLGTNYCPEDAEVAQIEALLVEPCFQLKRLDDEIAVMRKTLNKLAEERDALADYVNAHRTLISPLRRLPLDIIQEIFMACLPTHRNCVMSAQEAPVILGRICSSWRTISLSTPRLWSRLHIVEPTPARPWDTSCPSLDLLQVKSAQRLEVATAWLQRSGTCPLSISLESRFNYDITPPLSPSSHVFLNTLISFASRWQNVSFAISPLEAQSLLRLTEDDVPLLKSLEINERPGGPGPHYDAQWNISQGSILHAPTLSRFSLHGGHVHSSSLPLRWSNLTALTLLNSGGDQTCQVILDILSRCSQLQSCMVLVREPPDGYLQDSIMECPFLHTLHISSSPLPLQTSGRLLSRLSVPELQDFQLRGEAQAHDTSDVDNLASALAASTRLEFVNIDSAIFSTPCLMEFLRRLPPTIQHLHILKEPWSPPYLYAVVDDSIFQELEASPHLLPALNELVITECRGVSDEVLLRFIVSRMPTLRRVDMNFEREMQVDILPSLQSFLEAGAQISVTYFPSTQFSPWRGLPDVPPWP